MIATFTTVAWLLAGSAAAGQEPFEARAEAAEAGIRVALERDGDAWTADYAFDRDAVAWAFARSALARETREPWRLVQWRVETPGVVLERRGAYDVIRATDGGPVPRSVRFSLTPRSVGLEADYNPALVFTGGSVALYTDHFDVFALDSLDAVEPGAPDPLETADFSPAALSWRDRAGPVMLRGEPVAEAAVTEGNTYVLFGEAGVTDLGPLTTVIDTELPAWIGDEIAVYSPRTLDYYTGRLGAHDAGRPMVMASWNGPTPGLHSMGGSVMPGLIVMAFEGSRVVERSPDMEAGARWFVGHETAHFWLGETVRYAGPREAWITEGGADLMAIRAAEALNPDFDSRAVLQAEIDDCARLAVQPVADAGSRGEHRAYYACGAVFALVAEGAQRRRDGGDWFDWLRPVIDANREYGVLSREDWLAHLTEVSGDPSLRADIERLVDEGDPEAMGVIASLLARAGVAFSRDESGRVVLAAR